MRELERGAEADEPDEDAGLHVRLGRRAGEDNPAREGEQDVASADVEPHQ